MNIFLIEYFFFLKPIFFLKNIKKRLKNKSKVSKKFLYKIVFLSKNKRIKNLLKTFFSNLNKNSLRIKNSLETNLDDLLINFKHSKIYKLKLFIYKYILKN